MKAFFGKIGSWIVGHKVASIIMSVVLVAGVGSAIALPIALHEHSYAAEWSSDAENHWHDATCKHEGEKSDLGAHTYTNACDTTCDVCGYTRTVGAHVYDNACDTDCNVCGATRAVEPHVYDNACDTACNVCGATRTITHDYADTLTAGETTHWYACSVCGDKKDEAAHVFDKTVVSSEYLKEAATATTKAQYYKSCVCGEASATEYFETDKTPANLQVSDISKTYDGAPVAEPTVTFDGVGAENFAYYKGDEKLTERPTDAGTYKVVVTVDETDTHAGDRVEREFTIAKKVLSDLSVDLTYAGTESFEVPLGAANGILAGDVADGIKVCITFANKNVDAAVIGAGLDADDGDNYNNYELDLTTCTARIVKRPVWAENVEFTYDGSYWWSGEESPNQIVFQNMANGESMDSSFVTWTFDSINAGAPLTSVEFMNENDGRSNYTIDFSKCTASIVRADIEFTLKVTDKQYDGQTVYPEIVGLPAWFDMSAADIDIDYKLSSEGEDHYGMNNNPVTPGTYTVRVGISETANYESYVSRAEFTISKKPLTLNFTHVYDSGSPIPQLTAENGVVAGDDVSLILEYWQLYENAATYKLTDKLDAKPDGEHNLEGVSLYGEDKDNYTFTYDAEGYVGTLTQVPFVLDIPEKLDLEKNADGTNYITFVVNASDGYNLNRDVTVKLPIYLTIDNTPVTQYGVYSTDSGDPLNEISFGTPEFYINTAGLKKVDTFVLPSGFDADVTVYDGRTLYMAVLYTTGQEIDSETVAYNSKVMQGTLRKGDKIRVYASGAMFEAAYTIDKIEVDGVEVEFALPGDVVTIYSKDIPTSVINQSIFTDESGDIEATETWTLFAKVKMSEGKSLTNNNGSFRLVADKGSLAYLPSFNVIGADKIEEGGEGYIWIHFNNPIVTYEDMVLYIYPEAANLLLLGTATIIDPIEAEKQTVGSVGDRMQIQSMDVKAGEMVVIKITNELDTGITRFAMGEQYATIVSGDFTALLYTDSELKVDAEYQVDGGDKYCFKHADSTVYELAANKTAYLIFIPVEDVAGFNLDAY